MKSLNIYIILFSLFIQFIAMPNSMASETSEGVDQISVPVDEDPHLNHAETAILSYKFLCELHEGKYIVSEYENFQDLPYSGDEKINADQFWEIEWSYGYNLIDNLIQTKDGKLYLFPYKNTTYGEFYTCISKVLNQYFDDEYINDEYDFKSIPFIYQQDKFVSKNNENLNTEIWEQDAYDLIKSVVDELKNYNYIFEDKNQHIRYLTSIDNQWGSGLMRGQVVSILMLQSKLDEKPVPANTYFDLYVGDSLYYSVLIKNAVAYGILKGNETSIDSSGKKKLLYLGLSETATNEDMLVFISRYLNSFGYTSNKEYFDNDFSNANPWAIDDLLYLNKLGIDCNGLNNKLNEEATLNNFNSLLTQLKYN